jgi:hypothetical protein
MPFFTAFSRFAFYVPSNYWWECSGRWLRLTPDIREGTSDEHTEGNRQCGSESFAHVSGCGGTREYRKDRSGRRQDAAGYQSTDAAAGKNRPPKVVCSRLRRNQVDPTRAAAGDICPSCGRTQRGDPSQVERRNPGPTDGCRYERRCCPYWIGRCDEALSVAPFGSRIASASNFSKQGSTPYLRRESSTGQLAIQA